MIISTQSRTDMVTAVKDLIDANGGGSMKIYDKDGVFIVSLGLNTSCMTIDVGVGTFDNTDPYLTGVVGVGCAGTANYFEILDGDDTVVITGSIGDPTYSTKDIIFEPTRVWADYDRISVTSLTFTVPAGTNSLISE